MENVPNLFKAFNVIDSSLLVTADYGVPQTRKRRFWTNIPTPIPTHDKKNWVTVRQALNLSGEFMLEDRRYSTYDNSINRVRRYSVDVPSKTIITDDRTFLIYKKTDIIEKNKKSNYKARLYFNDIDKPARTIMTKDLGLQPTHMISNDVYARKLELHELAILQGFPSSYKFIGNKGQIRKMIGNAVPPPVMKRFCDQIA